MGSCFGRLVEKAKGVKEVRLLMLGLDNAGKTTILYKLKFNQTVTTIPTAGFNVECLPHKNDVGGQDKIRPLWRHYHTGTKALIFVVDSQDRDRIHEARVELHRILTARELQDAVLLIFANKQDLTHSMSVGEIVDRLQLSKFPNRVWWVQASCATTGEGLIDGLTWLAEAVKNPNPPKRATSLQRTGSSFTSMSSHPTKMPPSTTTTNNNNTSQHAIHNEINDYSPAITAAAPNRTSPAGSLASASSFSTTEKK